MTTSGLPDPVCFSLDQIETLTAWAAARPQGFSVRITSDHEDYPELAELYKHDRMSPLWFLNATQAGTAVLTKASGADQELSTVETALARVLELDRLAPDANWLMRTRAQRGWYHPLRSYGPCQQARHTDAGDDSPIPA